MDDKSFNVGQEPIGPIQSNRLDTVKNPNHEDNVSLIDLISSIKKIEEYLVIHDTEGPIQQEWTFKSASSSFYLWLKETYKRRSHRSKYFNPDYFSGEAAWNILIDLAVSQIEGKLISVTSACLASMVPSTTALRWIAVLEDDGMIEKEEDFTDRRRTFIRISNRAMNSLYSYYKDIHSYPVNRRRRFD